MIARPLSKEDVLEALSPSPVRLCKLYEGDIPLSWDATEEMDVSAVRPRDAGFIPRLIQPPSPLSFSRAFGLEG